jgi:hypothetical protein
MVGHTQLNGCDESGGTGVRPMTADVPDRHLIGTGWHPNETLVSVRENGREIYREVVHRFARSVLEAAEAELEGKR